MEFDAWVPTLLDALSPGDLLIITADHGNDPTYRGTDHTREYVPLISMVKDGPVGNDLGNRSSFADIGATIADYFGVDWKVGESFLSSMR
jgi:phosphopentomutase